MSAALCAWAVLQAVLLLERDDTRVERSARIEVVRPVLADVGEDGVLLVETPGVVLDFAGALLRGASVDSPGDECRGVGVRVRASDVTVRGARLCGFKVGLLAQGADRLVLEDCEFEDGFRQRLGSTPAAEDGADWLWPHENDGAEWRTRYGAAIAIEGSADVVVRRCRVRGTQNGLILDRVRGARVYDNDASFLSGWGLALWRSCDNLISRNAFDFCVRGYSHGRYSRGQDSAGVLIFEQSSRNVFLENSITHGGDGVFGFAGREALGEPADGRVVREFDRTRVGSNDNVFQGNDLSYATAHGLEMTFGFDNVVRRNRFAGNAFTGLWAGYAHGGEVLENEFIENGGSGGGRERGGVVIEHAARLAIARNRFERNALGVSLWWDPDEGLAQLPWALANGCACADNRIFDNVFTGDAVGVALAGCSASRVFGNRYEGVGQPERFDAEPASASAPEVDGRSLPSGGPELPPPLGSTRPVAARRDLRGRERIVIGPWGPYDWNAPWLVRWDKDGTRERWRAFLAGGWDLAVEGDVRVQREATGLAGAEDLVVTAARSGACATYALTLSHGGQRLQARGALVCLDWRAWAFAWTRDPREDLAGWREEARAAVPVELASLTLPFGGGGPSELDRAPMAWREARLPADRFGLRAAARVRLPRGSWRLAVTSDDGVRVLLDGAPVIEDWTWHAPRTAEFMLESDGETASEIEVEYFELDGHAVLDLRLEPRT